MNNCQKGSSCSCQVSIQEKKSKKVFSGFKQTSKVIPSFLTSLFIAFFPKCPICWAFYMNVFASFGFVKIPYVPWMLPVLICLMTINLFFLFMNTGKKGYAPFMLSLVGVVTILMTKNLFPSENWLLVIGMFLVVTGSIMNNFFKKKIPAAI